MIVVPGYGMAQAHAAFEVVRLANLLEKEGKQVRYAVHPVAGRMPGHMHVLLAEAEVEYEKLFEMQDINDDFASTDVVLVVGACDVVNPAANSSEDTPISGMPILNADQAGAVIVCNLDEKPGYSGVPNPLYDDPKALLLFGDAKGTLEGLIAGLERGDAAPAPAAPAADDPQSRALAALRGAQSVIVVPGYGMAQAHAAFEVVRLANLLEKEGKQVRYAVHPVAGRMPGHMHVLLAEAEVEYEKLFEMQDINDDFASTDVVLVVGACDVVNPAANSSEDTPISGMPILNADQAGAVIVCNLDEKPGYSGVPNPLYDDPKALLLFGDAKGTLEGLIAGLERGDAAPAPAAPAADDPQSRALAALRGAQSVIVVPGYGMAQAHAAFEVVRLANLLEKEGKQVRYAVHPVAGRMPGHMHVLLAEAEVEYEKLFEMQDINDDFASTDVVLVVGACDVVNPAANSSEDTPISGMPILNADQAGAVIVCNLDEKPGYSGVPNPLYDDPKALLLFGDAKGTLEGLIAGLERGDAAPAPAAPAADDPQSRALAALRGAQSVIVVPGYGMAQAHAAFEVVRLANLLEKEGKQVRYAVHPVAGRMPGHMHVLLAEAEVEYEKLFEMQDINDDFASTDVVLVVGACDVVNPAANSSEDTPISGMPILNADQAGAVIVCNLDEKPGYSGVPNPLYDDPKALLLFGDAKGTLEGLIAGLEKQD